MLRRLLTQSIPWGLSTCSIRAEVSMVAIARLQDALDPEALAQRAHLGAHCGRVGRVTEENLHRNRTALGAADQPKEVLLR